MGTSTNVRDTEGQNVLVYQDASHLIYQGTAIIPLSEVHDFFKQMPSVASSTGFELRLQMNLSRENSYIMTYPAVTTVNLDKPIIPKLVTSNQVIGHCCPFMMANPTNTGSTGLEIAQAADIGDDSTITLRSYIGWANQLNLLLSGGTVPIGGLGNNNPCRIYIPAISYTNNYNKQIIEKPFYSLKFLDYYIDSDLNKSPGSQVSRLINSQLSRVRNLYIIPILTSSNTVPSPFNSPLSSAPITVTPIRLKNFNIQIGGSNIFSEPLNFNYQYYNNNLISIMADINGNSLKSKFFGGQITKSMWENGYNVYTINLEKVTDEISDSLIKSFQLIFHIETAVVTGYDFYYMITYQPELMLDRSTGQITNSQ